MGPFTDEEDFSTDVGDTPASCKDGQMRGQEMGSSVAFSVALPTLPWAAEKVTSLSVSCLLVWLIHAHVVSDSHQDKCGQVREDGMDIMEQRKQNKE